MCVSWEVQVSCECCGAKTGVSAVRCLCLVYISPSYQPCSGLALGEGVSTMTGGELGNTHTGPPGMASGAMSNQVFTAILYSFFFFLNCFKRFRVTPWSSGAFHNIYVTEFKCMCPQKRGKAKLYFNDKYLDYDILCFKYLDCDILCVSNI